MTDKESNSDKSRSEKCGILGTNRAKKLEKTKDSDDENGENDDAEE